MKMRKTWIVLLTVVLAATWLAMSTGCRCKYPQEEMDAASAAIADAQTADAARWAPAELQSAEDMLARGERQINENECDDGRASAIEATRLAAIAKELALSRRVAAEQAEAPPPPPEEAPPPVAPPPLVLNTVYFDFDEYSIRLDQRGILENNGYQLLERTEATVMIEGHCDQRGTEEYNIALGQRRADSVKAFLVGMGVDSARLATTSYGEERLVDPGNNEDAWSRNRRGEFVVY